MSDINSLQRSSDPPDCDTSWISNTPSHSLLATNPIRTRWGLGWGVEVGRDNTTRTRSVVLYWSHPGGRRSHCKKNKINKSNTWQAGPPAGGVSRSIDVDFTLGCAMYWVTLWKAFHYCLNLVENLQASEWTLPQTHTRSLTQQSVWPIQEFATVLVLV